MFDGQTIRGVKNATLMPVMMAVALMAAAQMPPMINAPSAMSLWDTRLPPLMLAIFLESLAKLTATTLDAADSALRLLSSGPKLTS